MRRLGIAVLAGLIGGCGPRITEIPLDDLDFSYAFLVTADESGQPLRVVSAPALADDPSAPLPGIDLEPREDRFFLVSFTRAELKAAVPGFDTTRHDELELEGGAPPPRPTFESLNLTPTPRIRVALPSDTQVHAGDVRPRGVVEFTALDPLGLEASRLTPELTLVVPVDAEHCARPGQTGLRPFAATVSALADAFEAPLGVSRLEWLSADRILVTANGVVTWMDRGGTINGANRGDPMTGARYLTLEDVTVPREGEKITAVAVGAPDAQGRRELIVVGGVSPAPSGNLPTEPATEGWVRGASLGPEGLAWSSDAPQILDHHIRDASFLPDGSALLGTHLGKFWYRTTTSTTFVPYASPPTLYVPTKDDVTRIRATTSAEYPYVLGTKAGLHIWSESQQAWDSSAIEQSAILSAEPIKFLGIDTQRAEDDELAVFASTQNAQLVWRAGRLSPWQQPKLPYPPRFQSCASATNDDELIYERRPVNSLEVEDGYIHLGYDDCSALVMIPIPKTDKEPLCITLVPVEGEPVRNLDNWNDFRTALATRPGMAAVATRAGGLYVSEW